MEKIRDLYNVLGNATERARWVCLRGGSPEGFPERSVLDKDGDSRFLRIHDTSGETENNSLIPSDNAFNLFPVQIYQGPK